MTPERTKKLWNHQDSSPPKYAHVNILFPQYLLTVVFIHISINTSQDLVLVTTGSLGFLISMATWNQDAGFAHIATVLCS